MVPHRSQAVKWDLLEAKLGQIRTRAIVLSFTVDVTAGAGFASGIKPLLSSTSLTSNPSTTSSCRPAPDQPPSSLNHTMPTNGNLLFLTPCEAGVPSRRHLVVIRRAEAHVQELVNLLAEMNAQVAEAGVDAVTPCQTDLIGNKIFLIERAIFELERCTSKAMRA
jgi:hypothetical protein